MSDDLGIWTVAALQALDDETHAGAFARGYLVRLAAARGAQQNGVD